MVDKLSYFGNNQSSKTKIFMVKQKQSYIKYKQFYVNYEA